MQKHHIFNCVLHGVAIVLSFLPGTWPAPLNVIEDMLKHSTFPILLHSSLVKRGVSVDPECVGSWATAVTNPKLEALDTVRSNSLCLGLISLLLLPFKPRTQNLTKDSETARKIRNALLDPDGVNVELC